MNSAQSLQEAPHPLWWPGLAPTGPGRSPHPTGGSYCPRSVLRCKNCFQSELGDLIQIKAKGEHLGCGLPTAASPPQVPSCCTWTAASTGSGSCNGVQSLSILYFGQGKDIGGSVNGRRRVSTGDGGAQRRSWGLAGPAGLWEVALGEAQSSQAESPKISAGFNIVRDTPERGHRRPHCPTQPPSVLAEVNLPPAWPHGHFTCRHAGKHWTPCPRSRSLVLGLAHLLLLIPRA